MCLYREGRTISQIASALGRHKSTISRELDRNICGKNAPNQYYRASTAQTRYLNRRKACRRTRILDCKEIFDLVSTKFLEEQWSPEQIEGRLKLEGGPTISDSTIYRGIKDGRFNRCIDGRKAARRLRHRGKRRKSPGSEKRGKIKISHAISERPEEASNRERIGDWEGDTVIGKPGGACLLTLVDRKSGLLIGGKVQKRQSELVSKAMIRALRHHPNHSVTLDRGSEFAKHDIVTKKLGVEIYFAMPHHPWQRGTNENTNGLLREYFPKGYSLKSTSSKEVRSVYDKINRRPRKRLGYRTPYEVYYGEALRLI